MFELRGEAEIGRYNKGNSVAKGRAHAFAALRAFAMQSLSCCALLLVLAIGGAQSQVPPSAAERAAYSGLHAAAARGEVAQIAALAKSGKADVRDGYGRTPLHVAAYAARHVAMRALAAAGADPNALENERYDIVTMASVANDVPTLEAALAIGGSANNVTSRYQGTALIAAAHLGHAAVVRTLIKAGAPLDHVNNLGWTAVIEAVVLGDGGTRHVDTLRALLDAGADHRIADRNGQTPLALARSRGYKVMVEMLTRAAAARLP